MEKEIASTIDIALTSPRSFEVVAVPLSDHDHGHGSHRRVT
jgi:hypothetical protein